MNGFKLKKSWQLLLLVILAFEGGIVTTVAGNEEQSYELEIASPKAVQDTSLLKKLFIDLYSEYAKNKKFDVENISRSLLNELSNWIDSIKDDPKELELLTKENKLKENDVEEFMNKVTQENEKKNSVYVQKMVLENGMTVLVRPVHTLPKVSLQIWYNVGAKDEKTGERGIAHLIEHMIFKGTKKLSESDINIITHMLSGSTNAFTSWDYTGYLFNMPVQNWKETLPILADCMQNVSFKDDHLNSEMKAVIQELKMNKDNYTRSLILDLVSVIFPDHPYHYPVIGFKQDLFDVHANLLRDFYKKHYWPNNATLVVVGDVDVQDVFALAKKYFEKIPANKNYTKEKFYFNRDIVSHGMTLYRDVKQPLAVGGYIIPGATTRNEHLMDVIGLILGDGKGSRLYRKLVDELQLVTSFSAANILLFEHGVFMFLFEPKNLEDLPLIYKTIQDEIDAVVKDGFSDLEYERALKQARMHYYRLLESIETQAREIGKNYLATGDENFAFHFLDKPKKEVEETIKQLLGNYFKKSIMHTGMVMPLSGQDKQDWLKMQKESDEYDTQFLAARKRTSPIEAPLYAKTIKPKEATHFDFPKYQEFNLENGLKVLYYDNPATPKIDLILELQARAYYDQEDLPGLYNFVASMLSEGTKKYTAAQLADELESRGMTLQVVPGTVAMSMLATDLDKGLELLMEVLEHPRFDDKEIEKVREQLLSEIKNYWDSPAQFAGQLIAQEIYKGHPYSKNLVGTEESIKKITKKDLIAFHKKYFSPSQARMALVGDIGSYNLKEVANKKLGTWKGPQIPAIVFPKLQPVKSFEKVHPINRDQVILCFAGLSVDRKNTDYDKLLLFDQIFGGGALSSMGSKLFQLREQSGLFYSINGSTIMGANEQPGLVIVKTMLSLDRLDEAETAIKNLINKVLDGITPAEFTEAKHAIVNSIVNNFATNSGMARAFLNLDKFGFPKDYYDKYAERLTGVTLDQMKEAVKKVLRNEAMFTLKIGRVAEKK